MRYNFVGERKYGPTKANLFCLNDFILKCLGVSRYIKTLCKLSINRKTYTFLHRSAMNNYEGDIWKEGCFLQDVKYIAFFAVMITGDHIVMYVTIEINIKDSDAWYLYVLIGGWKYLKFKLLFFFMLTKDVMHYLFCIFRNSTFWCCFCTFCYSIWNGK